MAMDFFGAQDSARRNTVWLVLLFACAVVLLLLLTNIVVCLGFGLVPLDQIQQSYQRTQQLPWQLVPIKPVVMTSSLVLGGIILMMTLKWVSLRQGGRVVAESLGGERVTYSNATAQQRVLLNVVAEMALAANVPMPPVYVLPESAINAFAAGYSPADAVIGVTQGCIEQLNREELQGVIAHEFSHILNGDMRLNIRLMAWLYGILCIAEAGRFILEHSRGSRLSRSSNEKSNPLPLMGLGLLIIGYLGVFFGNLIKAAVSRQREFLADASAVQFTRNPDGIAGALKKIAMYSHHSQLDSAAAENASHLFFSTALNFMFGWMSTHPPLTARIQRIDPSWDGRLVIAKRTSQKTNDETKVQSASATATTSALEQHQADGDVSVAQNAPYQQIMALLPPLLLHSCQQINAAKALYLSTLLQPEHLARQLFLIKELGDPELISQVDRLCDAVSQLTKHQQLHLLQLAIPTLKEQTASQFRNFSQLIHEVVHVDGQQDLYEWVVQHWLLHGVAVHWHWQEVSATPRTESLAKRQAAVLCLLATVSQLAHAQQNRSAQAWQAGLQSLHLPQNTQMVDSSLADLSKVLPELLSCGPMLKRQIWQMLQAAVHADTEVSTEEQLLLQAFAFLLEIPVQTLPPQKQL